MSKITISDLASRNSESFITEINGLNELDNASLMSNIIGGLKIKFYPDGTIRKIKA